MLCCREDALFPLTELLPIVLLLGASQQPNEVSTHHNPKKDSNSSAAKQGRAAFPSGSPGPRCRGRQVHGGTRGSPGPHAGSTFRATASSQMRMLWDPNVTPLTPFPPHSSQRPVLSRPQQCTRLDTRMAMSSEGSGPTLLHICSAQPNPLSRCFSWSAWILGQDP